MIPLTRPGEPEVLAESKERWLARYLERRALSPGLRPPGAQYAHAMIVRVLEGMSFKKCFYCKAKPDRRTVDHYIEVAERPDLAFSWSNLYLACQDCQGKQPNKDNPSLDCLDPCDPSFMPLEHLTFTAEQITAKSGSNRGYNTIQKYRLDDERLDFKRLKRLKKFYEARDEIRVAMIADGRNVMSAFELETLRRFRERDQPYSLMFDVYLSTMGL